MKALTKKILIASVAVGVMTPFVTGGGGVSAEEASNNNVTVTESNVDSSRDSYGNIIAGTSDDADASNNTLTVSNANAGGSHVNAGQTWSDTANADNNATTVTNVTNISFLHGGYAPSSSGSASYNTVYVYGGDIYHIHAGHTGTGVSNYNKVYFYDGTVSDLTGAGYGSNGEANYNELNIYNGTLNGLTQGGYIIDSGNAIGNKVNIYGGTISGNIYGGYVGTSGTVANNEINVYNNPDLSNANLYAGYLGGNTNLYGSGNVLKFHTSEITAKNIGGFDSLDFYLPTTTVNGTNILTLTDSSGTDLSNTVLNVYKDGTVPLTAGSSVYLVTNNNGGLNVSNVTTSGRLYQGVSLEYPMSLIPITDSSGKTVSMQAYFGTPIIPQGTKAFSQGQVANHQLSNIMNDKMVDWLPPIDFDELEEGQEDSDDPPAPPEVIEPKGYEIFMNMGFAKLKTKTGDNSEVETKGQNYDLGAARVLQQGSGPLYIAPVFQYGQGDYDTYLPSGIHGQGKNKFFMGGIIARKMNNNGFYYEGSFRGGKAKNDFYSDDFKLNGEPVRVSYNTSAPVFAGHIKLGKNMRLNKNNLLDIYGIYFYTRQNGVGADLSTGEHYDFSSSTSHRVKIGYRLTTRTSKISRIYTEMAYQYERCSDISATYANLSTPQVGDRGSSGMFQVGWLIKPSAKVPLMLDLNATGWVGHQRGLTAAVKFKRAF